jgi:hypothetical protein
MLSPATAAKKQFMENFRLFADSETDEGSEKFNLYQGLANIADALEQIDSKLSIIEERISRTR